MIQLDPGRRAGLWEQASSPCTATMRPAGAPTENPVGSSGHTACTDRFTNARGLSQVLRSGSVQQRHLPGLLQVVRLPVRRRRPGASATTASSAAGLAVLSESDPGCRGRRTPRDRSCSHVFTVSSGIVTSAAALPAAPALAPSTAIAAVVVRGADGTPEEPLGRQQRAPSGP